MRCILSSGASSWTAAGSWSMRPPSPQGRSSSSVTPSPAAMVTRAPTGMSTSNTRPRTTIIPTPPSPPATSALSTGWWLAAASAPIATTVRPRRARLVVVCLFSTNIRAMPSTWICAKKHRSSMRNGTLAAISPMSSASISAPTTSLPAITT